MEKGRLGEMGRLFGGMEGMLLAGGVPLGVMTSDGLAVGSRGVGMLLGGENACGVWGKANARKMDFRAFESNDGPSAKAPVAL